jgi:predicted kinase
MRVKHPRTPHLPWSPGVSADDKRLTDTSAFHGREVTVTEKLDGENTTLYRDGLHARSIDGRHHPSRDWVKALHGRIARHIPAGWRLCGEYLFAQHSVRYAALHGYLYVTSMWTQDNRCLSYDETVAWAQALGLPTPPLLQRGVWDEARLRALRIDVERQEGYVARTAAGFGYDEFGSCVAKWVRPGHVTTESHWMHAEVVPNGLAAAPVEPGSPPAVAALWSEAPPKLEAFIDEVAPVVPLLDALLVDRAAFEHTERALAALRLEGVEPSRRAVLWLATALHAPLRLEPAALRSQLARRLFGLGLPAALAHQVLALVGLQDAPATPLRELGWHRRLGRLVDLELLAALAEAAAKARAGDCEHVELFRMQADELELCGTIDPYARWREVLGPRLAELGPAAADLAFATSVADVEADRIRSPEEALARSYGLSAAPPELVLTCGASGSGKSSWLAAALPDHRVISLDALRARIAGARDRHTHEGEVLQEAVAQLKAALRGGERVVWDATNLRASHRRRVLQVGADYGALATLAVFHVDESLLRRRNAEREHAVPEAVLDKQLDAMELPFDDEAHRVWHIDGSGARARTTGGAYRPSGGAVAYQ